MSDVRYFQLPERQEGEPVPLGPLCTAVEAFEPALHECLLRVVPVLEALGRDTDGDAFLIGAFRLLNRLDEALAEGDSEAGIAQRFDLTAERAKRIGLRKKRA